MATATDLIRRLRSRRQVIEGALGYFGLGAWWSSAFSRAEQDHIEACFGPGGRSAGVRPLTSGRGQSNFHTATGLLIAVAACLRNASEDRYLAVKVLSEAERRAQAEEDVIGLHFVYQEMIRLHSRWRDHFRDALNLTFGACHKQVAMSKAAAEAFGKLRPGKPLPAHLGFQKLAILLEKEGAFAKAIEVCKEAREQGWGGNWTYTIGSLAKKRDEHDTDPVFISRSGLRPI